MWFDVTPVSQVQHVGIRQSATLFATSWEPKTPERSLFGREEGMSGAHFIRSTRGAFVELKIFLSVSLNPTIASSQWSWKEVCLIADRTCYLFINMSLQVWLHLLHESNFFILGDHIFQHKERLEKTELVLLRKFRVKVVQVGRSGGCVVWCSGVTFSDRFQSACSWLD